MKKIFISSTFRDLRLHRDEIWKRLQGLEIEILGMERFGARKSSPIETCLEEVRKCDIYIGIIAMCAGTIHPELQKSYTEIEYEEALILGKDIWIYLIDENEGVIKTSNIEFGERQDHLFSFKTKLKKHTVDFFIDEKDLSRKIYLKAKKIVPILTKKYKRPKELECVIHKFKSDKTNWNIFISLAEDTPTEFFSCINDDWNGILLPNSVTEGTVVESMEDKDTKRYDFQYINKRGYRTTIEGINYPFVPIISSYDRQITKLLSNKINLPLVIEIINEMLMEDEEQEIWKTNLLSYLKKY